MPKIAGKIVAIKIDHDGKMFIKAQLNGKIPAVGTPIMVKWGSLRTKQQNSFLWVYYGWLIEHGGMKEHGFFCPESLHESMKAHFLSEKKMTKGQWQVVEEGTSTLLNKSEFGEFVDRIDRFICDFFEIDTSSFFQDYDQDWRVG